MRLSDSQDNLAADDFKALAETGKAMTRISRKIKIDFKDSMMFISILHEDRGRIVII
jgi:hypothetical protein